MDDTSGRSNVRCCIQCQARWRPHSRPRVRPTVSFLSRSPSFISADSLDSSATRIALRKGRGDERIAKLQDSPDMPEGEATYTLRTG